MMSKREIFMTKKHQIMIS